MIDTTIVKKVYHSVILLPGNLENATKPAAPTSNGRYEYVGVDDTKGFTTYLRQIGPAEVVTQERVGSCGGYNYKMQVPHRLVFYNDIEKRDSDELIAKLTKAVISFPKIRLQRIITDRRDLLNQEAPAGSYKFKNSTFYAAVDFFVLLELQADTCDTVISCKGIDNPFCGV